MQADHGFGYECRNYYLIDESKRPYEIKSHVSNITEKPILYGIININY
jgi:hypothetical protein